MIGTVMEYTGPTDSALLYGDHLLVTATFQPLEWVGRFRSLYAGAVATDGHREWLLPWRELGPVKWSGCICDGCDYARRQQQEKEAKP